MSALPPALLAAIDDLPADGWWHSSGLETFQEIAQQLLDSGCSEELVLDVLTNAYGAVANEYGA